MDHGSTYVWLYDSSDEEVVSDSELQEGMWLSLSDDSDEDKPSPRQQHPQIDPEGSRTKYDHLTAPDEDEDDEDEEEEEERVVPKVIPTYVELDLPPPPPPSTDHALPSAKKDVDYVEVQVPVPPPPPPPGATASGATASGEKVKKKKKKKTSKPPVIRVEEASRRHTTPALAPPPVPLPAPSRGIIKNRLVPGVRKMKRERVKWDRSDSNESGQGRRARRADTNVLVVKFNTLTGPSHVHTGDAVLCGNGSCTAILSHLSKVSDHQDPQKSEKVWVCEFCGTSNEIDIVPEEMPTKEDTTYMIAPAPVVGGAVGGAVSEDSMVVFCIDVSGSMCVTTEVPGKFQLKGHERVRVPSSLNELGEDQYMPRQRRDVTYVSRLQSVQAAVDHQLTTLARASPSQKVAIITFSDEVTVIGDGRSEVVTLAGDKLWSSDAVVKTGGEVPLPSAVKDTRTALSKKVFDLEEGGQTALGPAVLLSVAMASRIPGSKVVVCTDGLANRGVGGLDELRTDEAQAEVQTFYEDLGALAVQKGVTVSLVTIKGTDCKTLELGQVADKTGGQVTIVDPLSITKEFSSILANPIIATNVTTKIILHSELYFRREDSHESVLTIPVGNVTADTELSYEYGVRNRGKPKKKSPVPLSSGATPTAPGEGATATAAAGDNKVPQLTIDGTPHLPFQLQIEYTSQDGSRCTRVISQAKPTTKQREIAEKDIDLAVVGTHVAHQTAQLAMEGEYTHARMNALVSQRLMQRSSHSSATQRRRYNALMGDLIPLENELRNKQASERTTFGRQYSDDEDEERCMYDRSSDLMGTELARGRPTKSSALGRFFRSAPKKKKAISRRKDVSDELATYVYNMKSTRSSDYQDLSSMSKQRDDSSDEED